MQAHVARNEQKWSSWAHPDCWQDEARGSEQSMAGALGQDEIDGFLENLKLLSQHHGMSLTAQRVKLKRNWLYRVLRRGGNPKLRNIVALLELFGFELVVAKRDPKADRSHAPLLRDCSLKD